MIQEVAFSELIRVVTKSYGFSNDPDVVNGKYNIDKNTFKDARIIILGNTRFVTSGNLTFLVGNLSMSYNGAVFSAPADHLLMDQDNDSEEIWIPSHEIISIIPGHSNT
jgi:hypothetical protein